MAFERPVFFGYRVGSNLSDVIDKNEALSNILIEPNDLDIIRGAGSGNTFVGEEFDQRSTSVSRFDFQALSRLNVGVYRTLDRYIGDTDQHDGILNNSPGADISLRGNLNVNGGVGASAIRYRQVVDSNDDIGFRDISTSRVSAWSTTTNPPAEDDPIYYGGQIQVVSGGKLIVNTLVFGQEAEQRLFDAEIPTHTVDITINGTTYKMYAMKNIPLKFRGFFRRFNAEVSFTPVNNLKASWRIVNVNNDVDIQSYSNFGLSNSSELNYRAVSGAERDIEFYYPPDAINSIELRNIGITELPSAELENLNSVDFSFNDIKTMPEFSVFSPSLGSLDLANNPLYLSETPELRKITAETMSRIPSSVTTFRLGSCYYGSVRVTDQNIGSSGDNSGTPGASKSVIEHRLPNLITLDLRRTRRRGTVTPTLGRDDYDVDAYLPTVPSSCRTYDVRGNDFRNIPASNETDENAIGVLNKPELRYVNFENNGRLSDNNFESNGFPNATNLEYLNLDETNLDIPTLQDKAQLNTFIYRDTDKATSFYLNTSSEESYKLARCSSLRTIDIEDTRVEGFIPKFKGNSSLERFDAWPAYRLEGGRPDNGEHGYSDGQTFVLYKDTFDDCRETIEDFRLSSTSLLFEKDIEPDTFKDLINLRRLYWKSYGRTGGNRNDIGVPDVSSCPRLTHLLMPENNFTGSVPSMISNSEIRYINLRNNRLSGTIPEFTNRLRLYYINLRNNELTSFPGFDSVPSLRYLYIQNNSSLTGIIPNLSSSSPNLRRIYMHNCSFNGYTSGSFSGLRRLDRINLLNNDLSESNLDQIITDLHTLYQNTGITRVRVNLLGQSGAPNYNPRFTEDEGSSKENEIRGYIETLKAANWIISGVD